MFKVMMKLCLQGMGCVLGSVLLWAVFLLVVVSLDTCVDGERFDPYSKRPAAGGGVGNSLPPSFGF